MIASMKPRSSITRRKQDVHDADPLVVDARDPLAPEIRQVPLHDDPSERRRATSEEHDRAGDQRDRLIERNRFPGKLAQHVYAPPVG